MYDSGLGLGLESQASPCFAGFGLGLAGSGLWGLGFGLDGRRGLE